MAKIKKIFLIILLIAGFLLLFEFIFQFSMKIDKSISLKIPFNSYCGEKQDKNETTQTCALLGGEPLFKEINGKLYFKRELSGNTFEVDLSKNKIIPSDVQIEERSIIDLDTDSKNNRISLCNSDNQFCIENIFKGIFKKGRGIGFWVSPDKYYGIQIFQVKDKLNHRVIFREAAIVHGNSKIYYSDTKYWTIDSKYLILHNSDNIKIINLEN